MKKSIREAIENKKLKKQYRHVVTMKEMLAMSEKPKRIKKIDILSMKVIKDGTGKI